MKKDKKELEQIELSQMQKPLLEFLKSYNKDIPPGFPSASVPLLKKFKIAHPMLFKNNDLWSTDQHRKKLIDWLFGFNLDLTAPHKK